MQLLVLPSTSVNFLCSLGTLRQHSAHPRDPQSTFCASAGSSINFCTAHRPSVHILCGQRTICQLQSTFYGSMGPSLNFPCGRAIFHQHSMWLEDHPSTFLASVGLSVNFHECVSMGLYVNFTCVRRLPPTLCASRGLVSTFCVSAGPSANFCQLPVRLRYHPSSFSAPARYSVNFSCIRRTFCKLT